MVGLLLNNVSGDDDNGGVGLGGMEFEVLSQNVLGVTGKTIIGTPIRIAGIRV
jgi:hypothetical protein